MLLRWRPVQVIICRLDTGHTPIDMIHTRLQRIRLFTSLQDPQTSDGLESAPRCPITAHRAATTSVANRMRPIGPLPRVERGSGRLLVVQVGHEASLFASSSNKCYSAPLLLRRGSNATV